MDTSLLSIDYQRERECLRSIVLHRVSAVEKENEILRTENKALNKKLKYVKMLIDNYNRFCVFCKDYTTVIVSLKCDKHLSYKICVCGNETCGDNIVNCCNNMKIKFIKL